MSVLAKVYSCAVVGLEGVPVEVEVDISQGLPSFQIVGLPDAAVQESKERVRPAVRNSGFSFPIGKLNQNANQIATYGYANGYRRPALFPLQQAFR